METYTREYFRAMDALNCLRPDISPRATGHIPEMIELIQTLIEAGHAYEFEGNVYFDVELFRDYGKLSRRQLEDQEAGRRVEAGPGSATPRTSPSGNAAGTGHRCAGTARGVSAFPAGTSSAPRWSMKYLGETLDIHGAGRRQHLPAQRG